MTGEQLDTARSRALRREATGRTHTWMNKHISKGRTALQEMAA